MSEAVERIRNAAQVDRVTEDVRYMGPQKGVKFYLRQDLVRRVVELLQGGSNVLLRGGAGVGKTALARSLGRAEWPSKEPGQMRLLDTKPRPAPPILETTPAKLIVGCHYAHDLENKCEQFFGAVRSGKAILFIDPLDELAGLGSSSNDPTADVANMIMPHLDRGLQAIGTATPAGEARLKARNDRLLRRFVVVDVPPPDETETAAIAALHFRRYDREGISVSDDALEAGLAMVSRYMPAEVPLNALLRVAGRAASREATVDAVTLRAALSEEMGVLPCFVGVGEPPSFWALRERFCAECFGQEEAVDEIADAMVRFATGLAEPRRPVASFLFAGPSGCGKTSLALAAARVLTGDETAALRFDMSEYCDPFATRRLLANEEGSLVGRVAARNAGVLLFDEIEKAHPLVVRLLLQALGEARLTGDGGRTVRLDNYLVILTSNVGSRRWTTCKRIADAVPLVLADCAEEFPPEFRARLTRTVVFRPLDAAVAERVVARELMRLNELPGLVDRGLQAVWDRALASAVGAHGVSVERGARGLQSVVRTLVASPLARWLAEHPEARDGIVMVAPRLSAGELVSLTVDWVDDSGFFRETMH